MDYLNKESAISRAKGAISVEHKIMNCFKDKAENADNGASFEHYSRLYLEKKEAVNAMVFMLNLICDTNYDLDDLLT